MRFLVISILLILSGFQMPSAVGQTATEQVTLIRVDGVISPLTASYVKRGLKSARDNGSVALIIELDTPGGLLESTKEIVQTFFESEDMPIVVYVSPQGASAASAGTFITMAAHIAVMAPATNIGAASPVQMGGEGSVQMDSVMQKKIFNHTESFIESIAEKRHRNAEWAISAVQDGKSITADKAVELNVVDFIAENRKDLLAKLDGLEVEGKILNTQNARIEIVAPNMAEKWLSILIRPEVILILTMLAIYGIVGELTSPGAIIPGVAGAISLILVLFAASVIPINTAGFIFIVLAVVLFVAEAFTPTFGILITGGAVSFFLGAMMLFQNMPESMSISFAWLIPSTIVMVLFFIWIAFEGIRIQFRGSAIGAEAMVGKIAKVIDDVNEYGGRVFVMGEYWNAISNDILKEGEQCVILEVINLTLKVGKVTSQDIES